MAKPEKRSEVIEVHWENALIWGTLALLSLVIGLLFLHYGKIESLQKGEAGFEVAPVPWLDLRSFSWPFFGAAPLLLAYAVYRALASRKEPSYTVACSYCGYEMVFVEPPQDDFVCDECHRRVPVKDGRVLEVTGVTCGYCGALNYMSEKTEVLICEQCDREIPLLDPETGEMRHVPKGFARVDDESVYELVLVDVGRDREEVITSLQHMLGLTRPQVKDLLEELPVVLLRGINRRKAEMLRAQLEASGAIAEFRPVS
ncbi:MAG: ribosomal protein L7/L12 [Fimbriimonadales bacterium]|nr:ribosomal protein L7/L12 [Fimbriimonadales bacterium]